MFRSLLLALLRFVVLMLVAGLAGATLVRVAPGFSSDAQELTPGLSSESIQAIREARLADSNVPQFYLHYLNGLLHGNLGTSQSLNEPVRDLLRDRLPVSLRSLALALLVAWSVGLALAVGAFRVRSRWFVAAADSSGGAFISTPAAVLALVFLMMRWPPVLAVGLLVFPKIYRYSRNLMEECLGLPHIVVARAKGVGPWRLLSWHVVPIAIPQLIALVGVSISLGLGALLPVEVFCDLHGIGQLAWTAAQSRDLPLLVNLTFVVSCLTIGAIMCCDQLRRLAGREATA
ncbi:MAG TPA: ABC transporter permease [Candidatus Acidoferrales bacterium]|nr:ABC transporter permease [Candidatus Acidoferrales bacterium]